MAAWGMSWNIPYGTNILEAQGTGRNKNPWSALARQGVPGEALADKLRALKAIPPSKREQIALGRRLCVNTEFFSVICPDYETEVIDGRVVYNFKSVRDGIGEVAIRALAVHADLYGFCQSKKLDARFVLAIADQEATAETCNQYGMTHEDFIGCLRRSQERLSREARGMGVHIETPLLTEIDPASWANAVAQGPAMRFRITANQITAGLHARWRLYERQIRASGKRHLSSEQGQEMFLRQAIEYAVVGRYLAASHRVILGLDHAVMAPFVRLGAVVNGEEVTPVVYFDRPDYA